MKLKHKGVHKKVGFIIDHCGGYDINYHIDRTVYELNIEKEIIINLFIESRGLDREIYIEQLRKGINIDTVFDNIRKDNMKMKLQIEALFSVFNMFSECTSRL